MNILAVEQQARILSALVEGNSIRSTSRMNGAHVVTILSLLQRVGIGCERLLDRMMHGLACQKLQLDEIWAYVGMKQKRAAQFPERKSEIGDFYTWVAIDADTKLVPCFRVGKRSWNECDAFVSDLRSRLIVRPQITSDAFQGYYGAIMRSFGNAVDYAQITKVFASELNTGRGRYSPPVLVESMREDLIGSPDEDHVSTSYIERQNLTMRMAMRRFTRLTNGFSKKLENLKAAVALHFAHYNLVRIHGTLRVTPAMAAGVSERLWSMVDLVQAALAESN
ncbi:MAG: IS1 family transposase [Candidatus Binataceae bacterium]|jgi:IS1 family transposase